jgi:hypothetical protein
VGVPLGVVLGLCDVRAEPVGLALELVGLAPPVVLDAPDGDGEVCPAAAPGERNACNWVRPMVAPPMIRMPPATAATTIRRRPPNLPSDFGT